MLTDDNARDICSSLGPSNQAVVDIKGYKANFLIMKNLTIPDFMNISISVGKFNILWSRGFLIQGMLDARTKGNQVAGYIRLRYLRSRPLVDVLSWNLLSFFLFAKGQRLL